MNAVYVQGTNFENKGAELMLHAINEEVKGWNNGFRVSLSARCGTIQEKRRHGFSHQAWIAIKGSTRPGKVLNRMAGLCPKPLRNWSNVASSKDLRLILDASGLIYSSHSPVRSTLIRLETIRELSRNGAPVVLMPQMFGPFESRKQAFAVREIVGRCAFVFPRDDESESYLREICPNSSNIYRSPDFSNLLKVPIIEGYLKSKGKVLLIPNVRMIKDRTSLDSGEYLNFLHSALLSLREIGRNVAILVHSSMDKEISLRLQQKVEESGGEVELIEEEDALQIKALIGASDGVIASRFHGIVSALCQGKPAIVSGWSHKYLGLLRDYDKEEWMCDLGLNSEKIFDLVGEVFGNNAYEKNCKSLKETNQHLEAKVRNMWKMIRDLV